MIFCLWLLVAPLSAANVQKGYVVRVDSSSVWIDLTSNDGASVGRRFDVLTQGVELKHPVTGESLGHVESVVANGEITELSERYSTGILNSNPLVVKIGQRVRLQEIQAQKNPAPVINTDGNVPTRIAKSQSPPLDYLVNGMAIADFENKGSRQIVLASENTLYLYQYPLTDAHALTEYRIPGTGLRILGLEAANLDGTPGEELFVSVYDEAFHRFETRVFKKEKDSWSKIATLAFLTRAYQNSAGEKMLATQQIVDDKSFPFGALYPLTYEDEKYKQGHPALKFNRVDWLFGFTTAQLGTKELASLLITPVHTLRVQFRKDSWKTVDDDYGQTPVRVRWFERLLEFHPPMLTTYNGKELHSLYAVRNMAALGGLASPFGIFNRGELVSKRWDGLSLMTQWRADLSGCAQGLALVDTGDNQKELAVAIRGSAGQSSVWIFDL